MLTLADLEKVNLLSNIKQQIIITEHGIGTIQMLVHCAHERGELPHIIELTKITSEDVDRFIDEFIHNDDGDKFAIFDFGSSHCNWDESVFNRRLSKLLEIPNDVRVALVLNNDWNDDGTFDYRKIDFAIYDRFAIFHVGNTQS